MPVRGEYAAIVLAGGGGRRLGGPAKPVLPVAGQPMLHRVLAAVADAGTRIVVGPPELSLPDGVLRTSERPPGGGPAAASAAGLALLPPAVRYVALLAADLPLLTAAALRRLREAAATPGYDGAVYVDGDGRPQWLCGVWRAGVLRERRAALPDDLHGAPVRRLLGDLRVRHVAAAGPAPPWWDCDTGADLRRAEEWADEATGQTG